MLHLDDRNPLHFTLRVKGMQKKLHIIKFLVTFSRSLQLVLHKPQTTNWLVQHELQRSRYKPRFVVCIFCGYVCNPIHSGSDNIWWALCVTVLAPSQFPFSSIDFASSHLSPAVIQSFAHRFRNAYVIQPSQIFDSFYIIGCSFFVFKVI
jgi:hypothetical protein